MQPTSDNAHLLGQLARHVRDASVPAEDKERLFDAVEALAAAYATPAFGDRYGQLLQLAAAHAPLQEALQPTLLRLSPVHH